MTITPYWDGFTAYQDEIPESRNPFLPGSVESDEWSRGWMDAAGSDWFRGQDLEGAE